MSHQSPRTWSRLRAGGAIVAALTLWGQALAQYQVRQDGHLLDANPQFGANRYNYGVRPVSPLTFGNAVTSGNVRGGLAFQGYEPISDPTSFRGSLGSGALSSFRRDSVSAADASSLYGPAPGLPYFDSSTTVYTGGFLSGQYGNIPARLGPLPGASAGTDNATPGIAGPLDLRLDRRVSVGPPLGSRSGPTDYTGLQSQIVGLAPGNTMESSSSIFGPLPANQLISQPYRPVDQNLARRATAPAPIDLARGDLTALPREETPVGSRPPLGTPLDLVRRGELPHLPLDTERNPYTPSAEPRTEVVLGPQPPPEGTAAPPPRATGLPTGRLTDASMLPGSDMFTDMQLALSLSADPSAPWFADMQAAIRDNPRASPQARVFAAMQSQDFISRFLQGPVGSFSGQGDNPVNNELVKAEALLDIGQYFDAARRFDSAHRLAPLNPLPLIGKGNAYLAAGEYRSAAGALIQGFERYPELSKFQFDLTRLMGGGEIVDIRRADLQSRLAGQEDPRLRFLLGYLEYYGGQRESGLKNLEKAAELDQSGSVISRFPAMLKGEGKLPPPKLPSSSAEPGELPSKGP